MGPVFPPDWEMSERISVEFCDMSRKALERLMFKRKLEIDTKLLLHAIQRTTNFESLLSRRFTGITLEQVQKLFLFETVALIDMVGRFINITPLTKS